MLHGSWWNWKCSIGLMAHRLHFRQSDAVLTSLHTQGILYHLSDLSCVYLCLYIPSSLVNCWVTSISCIIISNLRQCSYTPIWCPWGVGSHAEVIEWTRSKGLVIHRLFFHHYCSSSVLGMPGIFFWPLASPDHTANNKDGQNHEDGSGCDWSNDHSFILLLRLFTGV